MKGEDNVEGGFMDKFFVFTCQEESAPCMLPFFLFSILCHKTLTHSAALLNLVF